MASNIPVRRSTRNRIKTTEPAAKSGNSIPTATKSKITTSSAADPENRPRTRATTNSKQTLGTTSKAAASTTTTIKTRTTAVAGRTTRSKQPEHAPTASSSKVTATGIKKASSTVVTTTIRRGALVEVTKKLTNKEKQTAIGKGKGKALNIVKEEEEVPPTQADGQSRPAPPRVFSKPAKAAEPPPAKPVEEGRRVSKRPSGDDLEEGSHRALKRRHTDEEEAAAERRVAERRIRDAERLRDIRAEEERHKEEMRQLMLTEDSLCEAGEVESELILNIGTSDDLTGEHVLEVEDEVVEGWDDLDKEDEDDPAMVSEYAADAFMLLREQEIATLPNPSYISSQPELEWETRSVLIDWLIQVHAHCRLLPETLFLTVNILDRFLSKRPVSVSKFQLVGLTALLLASKFEETYSPSVQEIVDFAGGTYKREEVLKAERFILRTLDWSLSSYPGPMSFLRRCSRADGTEVQARTIGKYLCEVAMVDWRMLSAPPSLIAAAGIWLGRLALGREVWTANMRKYSGYKESELMGTVAIMIEWLVKPSNQPGGEVQGEFDSLLKKYASRKFMKASVFIYQWAIERWPTGSTVTEECLREMLPRLKEEAQEERERLLAEEASRAMKEKEYFSDS